ncbi:hypothetical protein [Parasphingorhabdus pacifica]
MTITATEVPSHYDPIQILAETFEDEMLANHIGPALTCFEVNVLASFLDSICHHDGANYWLLAHQQDCDEPHLH